ncbi:MAG TPA: EamA family transporter RarD [Thermoanaerobaculia bacterium]|nr:EamA family transporter RarD [Thermoanaerobaculia bacterium]
MTASETRAGLAFGVGAYVFWGVVAIYFRFVRSVAPLEILAHRIVWSVVVLVLIVAISRRWTLLQGAIRVPRSMGLLFISSVLIAVNWLVFIYAVTTDHLVDASLGYFLNPLVNVLLGFLVLHEKLRRIEWVSVAIAAVGVTWLIAGAGVFPWISLVLAVTFALYGLTRKVAGVTSIEALTIETAILLPIASAYLVYRAAQGTLAFAHHSTALDLLLIAAGPLTAIPLLLFASAVRRLRLATVGLLQYISPTIQFVLAVAIFHEPFGKERLIAFAIIWTAIAIYASAQRSSRPPEDRKGNRRDAEDAEGTQSALS